MQANGTTETPPSGVVELREDIPLKGPGSSESSRCCSNGPRFILACFAALTAAITLALLTQIYYGDYELVPHGSVSSSAAACSRAGTDILKSGGRSIDAAATTALCLAILKPKRTSLDASGSLLYWDYRTNHKDAPLLREWGEIDGSGSNADLQRTPRMLAALVSLHAELGALPWSSIVQTVVETAREQLLNITSTEPGDVSNLIVDPVKLAYGTLNYLETFKHNTSIELATLWGSDKLVRKVSPVVSTEASWIIYAGGSGAKTAGVAISAAVEMPDPNNASTRVLTALLQASSGTEWLLTGGASGLAVVDRLDTYVALVTGLSKEYGSGPESPNGWMFDAPTAPLDIAPAIIVEQFVCGTRYIIGAESSGALAQTAVALLTNDGLKPEQAVEAPRVSVIGSEGILAIEPDRDPIIGLPPVPLKNATKPYPAVNIVVQNGDALTSHADSRGGGMAVRF